MRDTFDDKFLCTERAAHYIGYTKSTLEWWRMNRRGPRFYKISGRVRYRQSDLDAFMENSLVETRER